MVSRSGMIKLACVSAAVAAAAVGLLAYHDRGPDTEDAPPVTLPGDIDAIERHADDLMSRAFNERDPRRFDEAGRMLAAALKRVPERDCVYATWATLVMQKNDYLHTGQSPPAQAHALLQKALDLNPRCLRALENLADYFERRGAFTRALAVDRRWLAAAVAEEQRSQKTGQGRAAAIHVTLRAQTHRGKVLVRLGRYREAEKELARALTRSRREGIDAALVKVQEYLAEVYTQQGKYAEAEKVLKDAVRVVKRSGRKLAACPYTALGGLYRSKGDHKKAAEADKKAADQEPARPWMQHRAAVMLYKVGDLEGARAYALRARRLLKDPAITSLVARIERSRASSKSRDAGDPVQAAVDAFEDHRFAVARRLLGRVPKNGRSRARAAVLDGFLLLLEKKLAAAGERFAAAARAGGDEGGAAVGQGHLAIARKDHAAARRLLLPALDAGSRRFSPPGKETMGTSPYRWMVYRMACLGLGWTASNVNKHRRAIGYFDRVIARKANDIFAWLGKAIKLNPNIEFKKFNGLARIFIREGKYARARALLRRSIENYPHDDEARTMLASIKGKGL